MRADEQTQSAGGAGEPLTDAELRELEASMRGLPALPWYVYTQGMGDQVHNVLYAADGQSIADSLNADLAALEEETDENGPRRWDEGTRAAFEFMEFASERMPRLLAEVRRLRAAQAWVSTAERLPEHSVPVLAYFRNYYGMGRVVRATYARPWTLEVEQGAEWEGCDYDDVEDQYYCPEGWYEENDGSEALMRVGGEVTHWQPLPAPPVSDQAPSPLSQDAQQGEVRHG
jgi:hypothetical protein